MKKLLGNLVLRKETIANLQKVEMNSVRAGLSGTNIQTVDVCCTNLENKTCVASCDAAETHG